MNKDIYRLRVLAGSATKSGVATNLYENYAAGYSAEYGEIEGKEGPFKMPNGRTVYYSIKESKFFDPRTGSYLSESESRSLYEQGEYDGGVVLHATKNGEETSIQLESIGEIPNMASIFGKNGYEDFTISVDDVIRAPYSPEKESVEEAKERAVKRATVNERELTKSEKEKLDKLKKRHEGGEMYKSMIDQYGKEQGESVFYGKLTQMAKENSEAFMSAMKSMVSEAGLPGDVDNPPGRGDHLISDEDFEEIKQAIVSGKVNDMDQLRDFVNGIQMTRQSQYDGETGGIHDPMSPMNQDDDREYRRQVARGEWDDPDEFDDHDPDGEFDDDFDPRRMKEGKVRDVVDWDDVKKAALKTATEVHGNDMKPELVQGILTNTKKHKPDSTAAAIEIAQDMLQSKKGVNEAAVDATVFGNNDAPYNAVDDKQQAGERRGYGYLRSDATTPKEVIKSIDKRIKEIQESIDRYDRNGYNEKSVKVNAIEALEQIKKNLERGDLEGLKEAQIYFGTLMSPIWDMLPAQLVTYLTKGPDAED